MQFAASVPVPDSTTTFLDIGTDTFSQSLYDDLGEINLGEFNNQGGGQQQQQQPQLLQQQQPQGSSNNNDRNNNSGLVALTTLGNNIQQQQVFQQETISFIPSSTAAAIVLNKPGGLQNQTATVHSINLGDLVRIKAAEQKKTVLQQQPQQPASEAAEVSLKNLMEPLPASALKGLIKVETASQQQPQVYTTANVVKLEHPEVGAMETTASTEVFSPMSTMSSPGSPGQSPVPQQQQSSGGGKIKGSPSRKKSTSSTEEEDISSIPSLKMRIQIISQRVRL